MNVTSYLQDKLKHCTAYDLTDADRAVLKRDGLEAFINKILTNKKFRKWAIDEQTEQLVKRAIHLNVLKNQPIQLTLPFGGYKLWRLPSGPEVDWAEFFALSYFSRYLAPIVAVYPPGANFTFCSDDIIVERMNNLPADDTKAYAHSFQQLMQLFHQHLPENFRFAYMRIADLYPNMDDFERDLTANLDGKRREYESLPPAKLQANLRMSSLNIRWDGVRDWTGFSEPERQQRILDSAITHDAYRYVPRRREYVRAEDKVVIFPDRIADSIGIGSTKTSTVKFWIGSGVLEQRGEKFYDRILSPEQLEKATMEEHDVVPIDLIPLKNFSEVWIFHREFQFSE